MDYLIVQNRQTILLGPTNWRQRFFQNEINELVDSGDLTVSYSVPATEQSYINVGDGIEIIPATLTACDFNPIYEELSGPFWTFNENNAEGNYNVISLSIDRIKQNLKQLVAKERYQKQISGTEVTIADTTFFISTDIDTINQLVTLANSTGDNTINYKSPKGFISITGSDIQNVVTQIHNYIQTHFDWELDIINQIDNATDIDTLKNITIVEPEKLLNRFGV